MTKKKIVIDARESGTSTGRYIDKLIEHLHALRPKYEVIVLTKSHRIEFMQKIAPKFTTIKSDYKEFGFAEQTGFMWQLYRLDPDLVHFGMTQQPILYLGRTVTTVHDLTTVRFVNPSKNRLAFTLKQLVYKGVIHIVARKSAKLLTPSEYVKDDLARFTNTNSRKITVTYESADELAPKSKPIEALEGKPFILFNGRPLPHKNLRRLIRSFVQVHEKFPDLLLVIAGKKDASYRSYASLVKKLGLSESVIFTDFIPDDQLRWAQENAKAYVCASLSEGFFLPALEAMMYDNPLISSNATCLPEVCGDAAEYFDPLDIDDMARKIIKVLSNEKRQKELIIAGRKQLKKYSWRKMAEETLSVYDEVLE